MIKSIVDKTKAIFRDPVLKKKIIFTFLLFLIFRIFAFLPVPAVNLAKLKILFAQSQFLSLLDIFSGGTLANFSILALGLGPYINASIIIQLITLVIPDLEKLQKEGEYGRAKINQYTRLLTIPIAIFQGIGMYALLSNQKILTNLNPIEFISFITTITAGTFIVMWLGELITEFGVGNGISLLIFAGIVARLPVNFTQVLVNINAESFLNLVVLVGILITVVFSVVFTNEAIRKIPVFYSKRSKGGSQTAQGQTTYLPLKLNQAGVIPIIFAVSFVLFPQMLGNFLGVVKNPAVQNFGNSMMRAFDPSGFFYNFIYFILVVAFTFFYTMVVFNPQKISEEIQKHGGFIPGIRPGVATKEYLEMILYKTTGFGAVFLGIIAILPTIASKITNIPNVVIGGTGILIIVSVVLETYKSIEAQMVMKNYDKFIN
jgi:preprotein translocase subunit SecY